MINNEQLLELLPKIKDIAHYMARNGCDEDDLVQYACLKLLTREHTADYPIVTAISTMKDYCKTYGYHPGFRLNKMKRVAPDLLGEVQANSSKEHKPDWSGINWTEEEREVVRLYCEEGLSRTEINERYGQHAQWASEILSVAAIIAADAWNDGRLYENEGRDRKIKEDYYSIVQEPVKTKYNRPHKLTVEQVKEVYACKGIDKQKDVAKKFGLNIKTVYLIWNRRAWKHVTKRGNK